MALIVVCGPRTANGSTGAPLTDVIAILQIRDRDSHPRGP